MVVYILRSAVRDKMGTGMCLNVLVEKGRFEVIV